MNINQILNYNNNINVLLIIGNNTNTIQKYINNDNIVSYSGFHWDMWKQIEKNLKNKYNFKIFFSDKIDINTYDGYARDVYSGKYDLVIGGFYYDYYRIKFINNTVPLLIDKPGILHKPLKSKISGFTYIISKNFKSIINIFIVGIILGSILSYINKSKRLDYIHTILSVMFSMFGQVGNLINSIEISVINIIVVTIILLSSLILLMKLQADITSTIINNPSREISKNDINKKRLIGFEGDANIRFFKELNAKSIKKYKFKNSNVDTDNDSQIINNDNDNVDKLIKIYLKNTDKYDGIILAKSESLVYLQKYTNLISSNNFNIKIISYIVSKNNLELLNDINLIILNLRNSNYIQKLCISKFEKKYINNICSIG